MPSPAASAARPHRHRPHSDEHPPRGGARFADLGVPLPLCRALAEQAMHTPFPIQAASLPDSLAGRDVLGRGRTGSGKTVAFAVPVVAALAASKRRREPKRPRAMVLVPTRELAKQVAAVFMPLAASTGLRVTTIYGGVAQRPQENALRAGVDVVIACPGRLDDLIGQGLCLLDRVEVTVLDEADHLADLGFLPTVRKLLDRTPPKTQRLLFSATLDNGVDQVVDRYLNDPVTHAVDPVDAPQEDTTHHLLTVNEGERHAVVSDLASGFGPTLLFTRTKHGAKKLTIRLRSAGVAAVDLHGNLSQAARERNLSAFSDGTARVLVATDIAARGIHVDGIALVVHVDPPAEAKAFVHRSGRTARAGASGIVVTVANESQSREMRKMARGAGITPIASRVEPGHGLLRELAGPRAPRRETDSGDHHELDGRKVADHGQRQRELREASPRKGARRAQSRKAGQAGAAPGRGRGRSRRGRADGAVPAAQRTSRAR